MLSQKVEQTSYRKPKKKKLNEDGEEIDDDEEEVEVAYDGPSALVLSKSHRMHGKHETKLSESPLIQEILKNSKKIGKAAGETPIGQQAHKINEKVKGGIEDAKELGNITNPIIYLCQV